MLDRHRAGSRLEPRLPDGQAGQGPPWDRPPPQLTGAPHPPPSAAVRAGAFSALGHRNFRLFWCGQLLSLTGTWMHSTAQGWLVLELTDSALMLGLVSAAGSLPILLLSLYAGVIADRHDKRTIILVAQSAALAIALGLAVLTDFGWISIPWILVLVLLLGVVNSFEVPTRQSFFVDLVGKRDLPNAIALNSAGFNLTRLLGPAAAGFLIAHVGIAAAFYVNSLSYVAVIIGLLLIQLPREPRVRNTDSVGTNLREGFAWLWSNRLPRTLVGLIAALSVLAFPYSMLLPVFARDILGAGAPGLGALLGATGAGALAGGIALAAFGSRVRRGPLLLCASLSFCVLIGAFALSRSLLLSMVLLAGAGFAMILNSATTNALLQSLVPDGLRGRVMGVYVFMFLGMTPVGSLQAGALASWIGAPAALLLGGGVLVLVIAISWWRVPELRAIR